jgi:divalent metal cation (Fe/Co/Zn/Cd) transporter
MAVELMQTSVLKIFNPEAITASPVVILILIVSMFVKLIMFMSYLQVAGRIGSATLKSTAMDSLSDVLSTGIVLLSLIVFRLTGRNIDGFAGILVAVFIIRTGIEAARDTINPLLGEPPSKEFIRDIMNTVLAHENVLGVHDIVVHNYGPSRIMMSLHVEVPSDKTLLEVHDSVDEIEKELHQKYHCTAVIHMDPVDDSDLETIRLKNWLVLILEEFDPGLSFHDFRIVRKPDTRPIIEFDLEVPYKYATDENSLVADIKERLYEMVPHYDADITVDHSERKQ